MKEISTFDTLNKIDVSDHIEQKGRFNYLSWPFAVEALKKNYPTAYWTIHEYRVSAAGEFGKEYTLPYMYDPFSGCAFVKVTVCVEDVELEQVHPVLDNRNQPIETPNAFQVNTAIMRCLVKAIALHGLGLYIYAGEDLPTIETLLTGKVPEEGGMTVDQNVKLDALLRDRNLTDTNGFSSGFKKQLKDNWDSITKTEAQIYINDAKEGIRLSRKATAKVIKDTAKAIADSSMSDKDKKVSIEWLNEPRSNSDIELLLDKIKEKK